MVSKTEATPRATSGLKPSVASRFEGDRSCMKASACQLAPYGYSSLACGETEAEVLSDLLEPTQCIRAGVRAQSRGIVLLFAVVLLGSRCWKAPL